MVTTSYTVGQVEAVTRPMILRQLVRETDLGLYGTTTSQVSTTVMEDTVRLMNQYADDHFNDTWVYVLSGTGAGQILRITDYVASSGRLTHQTATPVGSGATYVLLKSIHPQEVLDLLDDIMTTEIVGPDYGVLTMVVDGDMEQPNTTDWAATDSSLSKVTTEPAMMGKRWLRVQNSGTDGHAASKALYVPQDNANFQISALVRSASGTARLTVWDATNGAALASVSTSNKAIVRVNEYIAIPENCAQIEVRLGGDEADADTYWDDVALYPVDAEEMPLPWWVRNRDYVREFYRLRPANAGRSTVWHPAMTGIEDERWLVKHSRFGRGQLVAENLVRDGMSEPVYFFGVRNETGWADDTEVKHIDQRLVVAMLAEKCMTTVMHKAGMNNEDQGRYLTMMRHWEERRKRLQRQLQQDEGQLNTPVRRMVAIGRDRYGSSYSIGRAR